MADPRTPAQLAEWDQAEAWFSERLDAMVVDTRARLSTTPRDRVASELARVLGEHVDPRTLASVLMVAALRLAEAPPRSAEDDALAAAVDQVLGGGGGNRG